MSDDEGIIVDAPPHLLGGSDDEAILVDEVPLRSTGDGARGSRKRQRRAAPREGKFVAWIVSNPVFPAPADAADLGRLPESAASRVALGVSECRWLYSEPSNTATTDHEALSPPTRVRSQARPPWGFVRYEVIRAWKLSDDVVLSDAMDLTTSMSTHALYSKCSAANARLAGATLANFFSLELIGLQRRVVELPVPIAFGVFWHTLPRVVRSIRLNLRGDLRGLVTACPDKSLIARWRRDLDITRLSQMPAPAVDTGDPWLDLICDLPQHERDRLDAVEAGTQGPPEGLDPLHMINALHFGRHLRDIRDFSEALDDAMIFEHGDDPEMRRDRSRDVSRSSIQRGQATVDIVGMLLQRREIRGYRLQGRITEVNLFTDSSPVTGEELQGMVAELILQQPREFQRFVLPGSTLTYGQFDAVNKTVALLFALWLVAGPFFCDLAYFVAQVRSIVTDNGVEHYTIEMPDIVRAFLAWLNGMPLCDTRGLVQHERRLFYRAMRLLGWSHLMGNLMKQLAQSVPTWTKVIAQLQELCRFFRNKTWRMHIQRSLRGRTDVTCLKSFSASLAHWRYETMAEVLEDLDPLTDICENHLAPELFANPQDRALVNAVLVNCRDTYLWSFIGAARREIFSPTEGMRHWGMVCGCPEHVKDRQDGNKHIRCDLNGRRLAGAWPFIATEIDKAKDRARALPPDVGRGNRDVHNHIKNMLQLKASACKQRFHYLNLVPWAFVRAGTQAGAKHVLDQVRSRALEEHDQLTQNIMRTLGGDIAQVEEGGECSPALAQEIQEMELIPLDESVGEGYHRATGHEASRAPASEATHLKQVARHKQELKRCRLWTRRYGKRGQNVVRFEWRHFKRVIQCKWKRRWSRPHMKANAVYARVYRTDALADQNWSSIVEREADARPIATEESTERSRMNDEYLNTVFHRSWFYAMPQSVHTMDEAGAPEEVETTEYFQVVQKTGSHSRPHLMRTFQSADEVQLTANLALEVQPCSRWHPAPEAAPVPPGSTLLYHDGDTQWMRASTLAPMDTLAKRLTTWKHEAASTDYEGCIVLSGETQAKPTFALLDEDCPTLSVVWWLDNNRWVGNHGTIKHSSDNVAVKVYDSRSSIRMKFYYQCLTVLARCVPLTSLIPSTQPKMFYKCLLAGLRTEPGLGEKHYTNLYNDHAKRRGKHLVPLPPPAPHPQPVPLDDDDGIMVDAPVPKAKAKARHGGSRAGPARPEPVAPPPLPPPRDPPLVDPPAPPGPPVVPVPVVVPLPPVAPPRPEPPAPDPPPVDDDSDDNIIVDDPHGEREHVRYEPRDKKNWQAGIGDALIAYDPYYPPFRAAVSELDHALPRPQIML